MSKAERKRIAIKVVYLRDEMGLEFHVIAERFGLNLMAVWELYKKKKEGKLDGDV